MLEGGLLGREVAAGLDRPAEPGIQRLDRVGGADQRADLLIEAEDRDELGPGVLPQLDDGRVAGFPGAAEVGERVQRGGLAHGGVNRAQRLGDGVPVAAAGVPEAVAQQVDDTCLGDGLRPDLGDRVRQPL